MKILVTSIVDLKKSQHNRPHQIVKYLCKSHTITFVSINDWWKGHQGDLNSYSRDFDNILDKVEYHYLTQKKVSPILQELFSSKKIFELLREDYDVHINYGTIFSGYPASKKLPTVYDIADDLSAMIRSSPQIPSCLRPIGGTVGDMMIRKNIQNSNKVTVTTDKLLQTYKIPNYKLEVIPNGVDSKSFRNLGITKEEIGIDGFIIGYVGVLREWVDLKTIFLALRELNDDIKMLVVGNEGNLEYNVKLAQKCGVSEKVLFTGMIPYSDVPKYISAMDICLIPFLKNDVSKNALPLKLFEYMACEKPVISTTLPAVKKTVGDMILYADNVKDFRDNISMLYMNDDLRYSLGIAGRKFVEMNYDWEKAIARFEKVLKSVVSN